jgi:Asp-tRNA(Asn)/Glu-tRNA(Gln) amidotransferase A subunit family amidase
VESRSAKKKGRKKINPKSSLPFEWNRPPVATIVVVAEKAVETAADVVADVDAVKDAVKAAVKVVEKAVAKVVEKAVAVVDEEAAEEVEMVAAEDAETEARGVRVAVMDEDPVDRDAEVEAEDAEVLASILLMSRLFRLCKRGENLRRESKRCLEFIGVESSLMGYRCSPQLEEFIGATTKVTD